MSADNYFLIRKHPAGGYAVVMGFASTDTEPEVDPQRVRFDTVEEALAMAAREYAEYGVSIHPEITEAECRPKLTEADRDLVYDALGAREPFGIWSEDDELELEGMDGVLIGNRDREWWAKQFGHEKETRPLGGGGSMDRCKKCGVGASCDWDVFMESMIVSVIRQLAEIGVLNRMPDAMVSTGTIEEPAGG